MGNIRVSYFKNTNGSAEVLEENNFYPFGMKHEGYNQTTGNPSYSYQYNGKELQTETGWSDYGARMYMSDIARWGVTDPLAETSRRWSPYAYAYNNPVMFLDPDGMQNVSAVYWEFDPNTTLTGGDYFAGSTLGAANFSNQMSLWQDAAGGGGSSTFGETQMYKDIMAYLAEPETAKESEYFQGINFSQFTTTDNNDCPKCPKSAKLGEEIGKQVLKPVDGLWEKLHGTRTWTDSNGNDYLVDSDGKIMMRAPLTGDVPLGPASNGKNIMKLLSKENLKSINTYKGLIIEHKQKLIKYIINPDKYDNLGILKNAPNELVRNKIIQSRINHLEHEIRTFHNNIIKIINGQ